MYCKVRLIVPLEQCKVQRPMEEGKVGMAVTQRRICEWGFGMVGVCVESHLRPAHNKREYLSHATNSEVHALMKAVDDRMRRRVGRMDRMDRYDGWYAKRRSPGRKRDRYGGGYANRRSLV